MKPRLCIAACHYLVTMGGVTAKHLDQLRNYAGRPYRLLSILPNKQYKHLCITLVETVNI